jgi:hypothetical protein
MSSSTGTGTGNQEIMELKRRLKEIKEKRAQQRQEYNRINGVVPVADNPNPTAKGNRNRAMSTSSQTADETVLSIPSVSPLNQSWNPRRLLCSTYKPPKPVPVIHSTYRITQRKSSKPPESSLQTNTGTTSLDRLDQLVCSKPNNAPVNNNYDFQRYSSLADMSTWNPALDTPQRSQALEHTVPRGKAYSEIYSDASESIPLMPSRSCISIQRETPWYVRPNLTEVIPDASAQVMNVVFYTQEEEESKESGEI